MTKITFLPCSLLLPFGVLVTLSTGELEFYEDVIPETSEENTLKELAKYLETEHLLHHYPFFLPDNSHKKKHYQPFNPIRQFDPRVFGNPDTGIARPETYFPRERSISPDEIFTRNSNHENLNQLLKEQKLWNLPEDDEISGLAPDVKHDSSYYNMNFLPKLNLDVNEYGSNKNNEYNIYNYGKYRAKSWDLPEFAQPKFTYRFGKANLSEKNPFAVGPNDPRYYQDAPLSFDGNPEVPEETKSNGNANRMDFHMDENYDDKNYKNYKSPEPTGDRQMVDIPQSKFHPVESNNLPLEVDRREEDDVDDNNNSNDDESSNSGPVIISVKTDPNNDIYFIAIVAGCSAAAMFTLVLISLTWCRLQRGAKAAADIEYPAYGITGPNKDISPSGDQRLAQSAQMYHFQHQKQQIIAMENRTAATRDPGSLSEAESDEENEEGDYTVYECPGLAPAGEMEVKNPLFHDDPTPATPAQSKDEDHVQ